MRTLSELAFYSFQAELEKIAKTKLVRFTPQQVKRERVVEAFNRWGKARKNLEAEAKRTKALREWTSPTAVLKKAPGIIKKELKHRLG